MISGAKVNQTIWNAQRFFERYGIERFSHRDNDLLPPSDQIAVDYEKLPLPDRYAVFSALQKRNETALLDRITDYPLKGPLSDKLEDLRTKLKKLMKSGGDKSLWKGRIAVQKTLYFMERWFEDAQKFVDGARSLFDIDQLSSLKNFVYNEFNGLYWEYLIDPYDPHQGNPLFDSDGDLDPWEKETWDRAFDHRDIDPLDSIALEDSDGDGVQDNIDDFEQDRTKWNNISVGEEITSDYGDFVNPIVISRPSENQYVIDVKVVLKADPEGDVHAITSEYLQPEFLKNLEKEMALDFARFVQNGNEKFTIHIQFNSTQKEEEAYDVIVTDRDIRRSNARMWGIDILEFEDTRYLWHEVFHLFGSWDFPDYYHEELVASNVRDCSFVPGRAILSVNHIMNNGTDIPLRDLRKIVHRAEQENRLASLIISDPGPQEKILLTNGEYQKALELGKAMQGDSLLVEPMEANETALELIVTSLLLMGRRSEAEEQLQEISRYINYWRNKQKTLDELSPPREISAWSSWTWLDNDFMSNVCQNLIEAKQYELAKEIYWKYPIADRNSLSIHLLYVDLLNKIPSSEQEIIDWWKEKCFPLIKRYNAGTEFVVEHIAWLEERGYHHLTIEYYQYCLSKDPTNLNWRIGLTVALLHSGKELNEVSAAKEEMTKTYTFLKEHGLLEGLTLDELNERYNTKMEQARLASPSASIREK